MNNEVERTLETERQLLIGDEVIHLSNGSHQIVVDIPVGNGVNVGKISENSAGEEVIGPPGTMFLEELSAPVGHWDIDRVADAWFRWAASLNLPEEFKDKVRTHLHEEAAKQDADS
jgi:hypothetical protein